MPNRMIEKLPDHEGRQGWPCDAEAWGREVPVEDLLTDSLFYPACGTDFDPIGCLCQNVSRFVYADYGTPVSRVRRALANGPGVPGYHLERWCPLPIQELAPAGWLRPPLEARRRVACLPGRLPGFRRPSAAWFVLRRDAGSVPSHGPERLSLLYLCAEGVQAYSRLYADHGISPLVLAVIRPGTGFGLNWTNFLDPRAALGAAVYRNPERLPRYMLVEEMDEASGWPDYRTEIAQWESDGKTIALFRLTERSCQRGKRKVKDGTPWVS